MDKGLEVKDVAPSNAYVLAFERAAEELRVLQERSFHLKRQLAELDAEIEEKLSIARGLAEIVAKEGNTGLREEFERLQKGPSHSTRTSVAYDFVRRLLSERWKNRSELSTADVLRHVKNQNIGIEPKAVYNALNYLQKTGKLRRVSRGHYLVKDGGYAVQSGHEVEGDRDMSD
jgi:hypothetical protein